MWYGRLEVEVAAGMVWVATPEVRQCMVASSLGASAVEAVHQALGSVEAEVTLAGAACRTRPQSLRRSTSSRTRRYTARAMGAAPCYHRGSVDNPAADMDSDQAVAPLVQDSHNSQSCAELTWVGYRHYRSLILAYPA